MSSAKKALHSATETLTEAKNTVVEKVWRSQSIEIVPSNQDGTQATAAKNDIVERSTRDEAEKGRLELEHSVEEEKLRVEHAAAEIQQKVDHKVNEIVG